MPPATFQIDLRRLAVGVLYLNLGRAVVDFPTTTIAHPSYQVMVSLAPGGPLDADHKVLFPMQVSWDIWRNVVAPLFAEGSVLVKVLGGTSETLRQQINREMLLARDINGLLAKIEQEILRGYEDQGYIPVETSPVGFVVGSDPPGSPIIPPGTNDGSLFTRFDT